jgi:integrase
MPRTPRGKRTVTADGGVSVAAKNPNGDGSVYYEAPRTGAYGRGSPGRWRATYRDENGRLRRVQGSTRARAEQRRDERLAVIERMPMRNSRFSPGTTVAELTEWWLESVARHQVRTSTLDSYRKFASYLSAELGSLRVVDVGAETLTSWQSALLDRFAPYTVLNSRKVCRQVFAEAVKFGLIPSNPFDVVRAPRAKRVSAGRALSVDDAKALIAAAQPLRLGAAVTLLFCQGWRVSEVLGLAWEDLDLEAGTAQIRRGAAYTPSVGTVLGSTKTSGAEGIHHLAPISIAHLRRRRADQRLEQERFGDDWPTHRYEGVEISMVFTTTHGTLVNRQSVTKEIGRAAKAAGVDPAGLASHTGRRTVITALYADGGLDLAAIARHVGHSDTATTAEYVRSLGQRPVDTARRAAQLLDPTASPND